MIVTCIHASSAVYAKGYFPGYYDALLGVYKLSVRKPQVNRKLTNDTECIALFTDPIFVQ